MFLVHFLGSLRPLGKLTIHFAEIQYAKAKHLAVQACR